MLIRVNGRSGVSVPYRTEVATLAGNDRRVRRTRRLLQQALVALITERGYERVTVQEVLDRADVGRTTFYAHYRDKDELLIEGLTGLRSFLQGHQRAALARPGGATERVFGFTLAMFEHVDEQRELGRALLGRRAGAIVMQHIRRIFADLIRHDLAALAPRGTEVPQDALVEWAVSSLVAILMWWVDRRARMPPAEADALFRRMTVPGLLAAIG